MVLLALQANRSWSTVRDGGLVSSGLELGLQVLGERLLEWERKERKDEEKERTLILLPSRCWTDSSQHHEKKWQTEHLH
jgi:hypothetical protein